MTGEQITYRPGDRAFVPDGEHKRSVEIDAVNDDGTYRVGSWSHEARAVVYWDVPADDVSTWAKFQPGDKLTVNRMVYTEADQSDWVNRPRTATVVRYVPQNDRERRGGMAHYEVVFADGETDTVSERYAKAAPVRKAKGERKAPNTSRAGIVKPDRATLPKIVAYISREDSGEFGNATCPHCGADGRYVWTFRCDDGTTRGAMAGCIKLFKVSPVAEEHGRLIERQQQRAEKGQELASWDKAKLAAIDELLAGNASEADVLSTIRNENARRAAWMDRRNKR